MNEILIFNPNRILEGQLAWDPVAKDFKYTDGGVIKVIGSGGSGPGLPPGYPPALPSGAKITYVTGGNEQGAIMIGGAPSGAGPVVGDGQMHAAKEWKAGNYGTNDMVIHNGALYEATGTTTDEPGATGATGWKLIIGGGSAAGVTSFNTRTGDVVSLESDYATFYAAKSSNILSVNKIADATLGTNPTSTTKGDYYLATVDGNYTNFTPPTGGILNVVKGSHLVYDGAKWVVDAKSAYIIGPEGKNRLILGSDADGGLSEVTSWTADVYGGGDIVRHQSSLWLSPGGAGPTDEPGKASPAAWTLYLGSAGAAPTGLEKFADGTTPANEGWKLIDNPSTVTGNNTVNLMPTGDASEDDFTYVNKLDVKNSLVTTPTSETLGGDYLNLSIGWKQDGSGDWSPTGEIWWVKVLVEDGWAPAGIDMDRTIFWASRVTDAVISAKIGDKLQLRSNKGIDYGPFVITDVKDVGKAPQSRMGGIRPTSSSPLHTTAIVLDKPHGIPDDPGYAERNNYLISVKKYVLSHNGVILSEDWSPVNKSTSTVFVPSIEFKPLTTSTEFSNSLPLINSAIVFDNNKEQFLKKIVSPGISKTTNSFTGIGGLMKLSDGLVSTLDYTNNDTQIVAKNTIDLRPKTSYGRPIPDADALQEGMVYLKGIRFQDHSSSRLLKNPNPEQGSMMYNSDLDRYVIYDGNNWVNLVGLILVPKVGKDTYTMKVAGPIYILNEKTVRDYAIGTVFTVPSGANTGTTLTTTQPTLKGKGGIVAPIVTGTLSAGDTIETDVSNTGFKLSDNVSTVAGVNAVNLMGVGDAPQDDMVYVPGLKLKDAAGTLPASPEEGTMVVDGAALKIYLGAAWKTVTIS